MYPLLVEPTIRNIMNNQLNQCNQNKFSKNTFILNLVGGGIVISIIGIILYVKYKGKQDVYSMKQKENKKRDYILSKLQFFQKMKTKEFTNMPI